MAESNGDFTTILGPDAHFKGDLQFEKGVRLLGKLEGSVTSKGRLHVADGASLMAEVNAADIQVEGEVKGNLKATTKIHLTASARLEGDIQTAKLEVNEGAVFVGRCIVGTPGERKSEAAARAGETQAGGGNSQPSGGQPGAMKKPMPQPVPAGK